MAYGIKSERSYVDVDYLGFIFFGYEKRNVFVKGSQFNPLFVCCTYSHVCEL